MKILVIHGSPHKGNTLRLTRKFEKTMKTMDNVDFEYLHVSELDLKMCCGCFNCIRKGEDFCPFKNDNVTYVIKKVDEADGVIFSAPTYMYNVPAIMKNLIDRFSYMGHRPKFINKPAVVISTTCGLGLKEAIKYLSFSTAGAWGFKLIGTIGAQTHPLFIDKQGYANLEKRTTVVARKFLRAIIKSKVHRASLGGILRFQAMKKLSFYSKDFFPADYKFYHVNENIGKNYYIKSAKTGMITYLVSSVLSSIIELSMPKKRKDPDLSNEFLVD